MKKLSLIIGAFFLMLLMTPLFSQIKPYKIEEKTEKPAKKAPNKGKSPTRVVSPTQKEVPTTVIKQNPQLEVYERPRITADMIKAFKKETVNDKGGSRELKVVGNGFITSDNSKTSNTEKRKGDRFCTTTNLNTDLNTADFKDFTTTGPPDWLKPGIIMDAVEFVQGKDRIEERYNRGPITITSNAAGAPENYMRVDNPRNKSSITVALSKLLSTDRNIKYPALANYTATQIHSVDELNYKINGRYSSSFGGVGSVSAALGIESNSTQKSYYYLVEFQQALFNLEVDGLDKNEVFPDNPEVNLGNYVYISRVTYGRKGYFMLKVRESLESLGLTADVNGNYLGNSASISSTLETLSKSKNVDISAFYYGGTAEGAIADILSAEKVAENGTGALNEYISHYNFSAAEAYPISYQLKNLDNEKVGMSSENSQSIETCVPYKNIKLKVTLKRVECQTTLDNDNIADYGIRQHIYYKANDKVKKASTNYEVYRSNNSCNDGRDGGLPNSNWNNMMCGSHEKQIHVSKSSKINGNGGKDIGNYMVFNITPEEANDKNAEFKIRTWTKEYSSGDNIMMNKDADYKLPIHYVLSVLTGTKGDVNGEFNKSYAIDGTVSGNKFNNFRGKPDLPLRMKTFDGKTRLEGPIRARNSGTSSNEKAFIWMSFELIED